MNKNEVITLSSDDEAESTYQNEVLNTNKTPKTERINSEKLSKYSGVIVKNNASENDISSKETIDRKCETSPELVDLVDILDKLDDFLSSESVQNSELGVIDLEETSNDERKKHTQSTTNDNSNSSESNNETNEEFNYSLKFFTEFVEFCSSFEKNPNDRARLTKKLMKYYGEADGRFINSKEFRQLIQKCKDKMNKNNLYLIAKEVTEELRYKKKVEFDAVETTAGKKYKRDLQENNEKTEESSNKATDKRIRFINKIVKKLDKLGSKIRELEQREVDLSDEEDSTYVLLQRYRERFCQIHTRLCAYTNQIPDPNNRKICFTESKYPAINKCIENWLNKKKRFPDFSDIMKLLESQSSSLNLPSNRDSIRTLAEEIFQKVGVMLQRRRIYDLWDTMCGFLDDEKDPAENDSNLDEALKQNFEIRVKKEQDIFEQYAQLQEKQKLEPEEVGDEEANDSPIESGNEDDKEIEEIENSLNRRVDEAIKNEDNGTLKKKISDRNSGRTENKTDLASLKPETTKETKNNYKNCKSLKWRQENSGKSTSEDSSTGTENDIVSVVDPKPKSEGVDSDLELIVEDTKPENETNANGVGLKRHSIASTNIECSSPKRKKAERDNDVFEMNVENVKSSGVFDVHCCQVFHDFQNFTEEKKDWKKRKVFRDLTNINKLMKLHGKRNNTLGLFSPSFFHGSFYKFEKPSWKKKCKLNFRLVGAKNEKCALNQKQSGKTLKSGGESNKKNMSNSNPEGGEKEENSDLYESHGNGSEEDNNGDENRKNERENDGTDNHYEEEEEEDDENESEDSIIVLEQSKQSIQKTEESKQIKEKMAEVVSSEEERCEEVIENSQSVVNTTESTKAKPRRKRTYNKSRKVKQESCRAKSTRENGSVSPEILEVQPLIWQFERGTKKPERNTPSTSDEDIVKRFLMRSPSSISITPPKKLTIANTPSQAVIQAMATLRNLKDISATLVRSKPETGGNSSVVYSTKGNRHQIPQKRRRVSLPVISSVQSIAESPVIVTVEGNVSGFEETEPRDGGEESSTIRISRVWGNTSSNKRSRNPTAPNQGSQPSKKNNSG